MIETIQDTDMYMYHYTTANTAIDYILKNFTIKIGQFTKTNDPKEILDCHIGVSFGPEYESDAGNLTNVVDEACQKINEYRSKSKIVCFCTDSKLALGEKWRAVHRGYGRPRMWAQYADKHKGICIVIDKNKFTSKLENLFGSKLLHHGFVNYSNNIYFESHAYTVSIYDFLKYGSSELTKQHLIKHKDVLLFSKLKDWESECEYRYLVYDESIDDIFVNIKDCISGVCVGQDFPHSDVEKFIYAAENLKIDIHRVTWHNGEPSLNGFLTGYKPD